MNICRERALTRAAQPFVLPANPFAVAAHGIVGRDPNPSPNVAKFDIMNYTGRRAEYAVLAHLLGEEVEAYPAIKTNQDDYDITVVRADNSVIRVQIKGTDLNSKGTNNMIAGIDKTYDFLVVVVVDGKALPSFFVMSKAEALQVKGQDKHLYVTRQDKKKFFVRDGFLPYKDKWEKLTAQ